MIKDTYKLANALYAAEPDRDWSYEHRIAYLILRDKVVFAAAMQWAETGVFPEEPCIDDWSPANLAHSHYPSQIFHALVRLRAEPDPVKRGSIRRCTHPDLLYDRSAAEGHPNLFREYTKLSAEQREEMAAEQRRKSDVPPATDTAA